LHKAVICQASSFFKALCRFDTSSVMKHNTPIPLQAFLALTQSWYTGIMKASPIDCFYVLLTSDFYNISEDIIHQCLHQLPQIEKEKKVNIAEGLSVELTHWLLSSKYLNYLCDEVTIQKIKKELKEQTFLQLIEQSPFVNKLQISMQEQFQLLKSLQQQFQQQQQTIQEQLQKIQEQLMVNK